MKTILVSGASGIVGYGILRSLRVSGEDLCLIGTSIYDDSVAQGFCDRFEKALPTNNVGYMDWLLSTIKKHQVDLIIPGIEDDMYKWHKYRYILEIPALLNNEELLSLCNDKWWFYKSIKTLPYAIETNLSSNFEELKHKIGLPFILKPRKGFGSKGIIIVDNIDIFFKHWQKIGPELMVQPIIGDEEYTTAAFGDGEGGFYNQITFKRKLSENGYTGRAEVVFINEIGTALYELCKHFKPIGPTNFQFRMHEGQLKLLEINPRISSSTSIRTAFGYNECAMAVEYFLEGKEPTQPEIRKGRAVRYTDDFIFYEGESHV